jgi:hypothetical protein
MVMVYQYKAWNKTKWRTETSDHKAIREEIARRKGAVIEETGEDVPESALDDNDCYYAPGA